MASKSALINALEAVPLFESCSKRELGRVAKAGRVVEVDDGNLIADQGQMGREAFVILSGQVAIKRGGRKIADMGRGDVVGELSLLDHGPRTASVVATTDCKLFVLEQKEFRKVLDEHPAIAFKLLGTLAQRIRDFDRKYYG
jgi:CRP/FNR family transcriptional regulator, cyclic AMP receptor protein